MYLPLKNALIFANGVTGLPRGLRKVLQRGYRDVTFHNSGIPIRHSDEAVSIVRNYGIDIAYSSSA